MESSARRRRTFEEASDVLGFDMARLCFEGDPGELSLTANAQPAILTASTAALRVLDSEVGHQTRFRRRSQPRGIFGARRERLDGFQRRRFCGKKKG